MVPSPLSGKNSLFKKWEGDNEINMKRMTFDTLPHTVCKNLLKMVKINIRALKSIKSLKKRWIKLHDLGFGYELLRCDSKQ